MKKIMVGCILAVLLVQAIPVFAESKEMRPYEIDYDKEIQELVSLIEEEEIDYEQIIRILHESGHVSEVFYELGSTERSQLYAKLSEEQMQELFLWIKYGLLHEIAFVYKLQEQETLISKDVHALGVYFDLYIEVLNQQKGQSDLPIDQKLMTYQKEVTENPKIDLSESIKLLETYINKSGDITLQEMQMFKNHIFELFGFETFIDAANVKIEEMERTPAFFTTYTITSYKKITSGISSGDYTVNNISAYCAEYNLNHAKGATISAVKPVDNELLRKALYYGKDGPGSIISSYTTDTDRQHILTAIAVSDAYIGEKNTGASSKYDVFYNDLSQYASPPAGFQVYIAITTSTSVQDLAFYVYEPNYTVTYDANGGSSQAYGNKWSEDVSLDADVFVYNNFYQNIGHTFEGWNEKANGTGNDWTNYIGKKRKWIWEKDITLYAQWKANQYELQYDKNAEDAKGKMEAEKITYGGNYTIRGNAFTYEKHNFIGWNAKSDGSGEDYTSYIGTTRKWNTPKDVTLYAVWDEIPEIEAEDTTIKEEELVTIFDYEYLQKAATAKDKEEGNISDKIVIENWEEIRNKIALVYTQEEQAERKRCIEIKYSVEDQQGGRAETTANLYIEIPEETTIKMGYVRFISQSYVAKLKESTKWGKIENQKYLTEMYKKGTDQVAWKSI